MAPKQKNAAHSNFVFLSYAPNPTRTDQVLQDSQRRAHAARKAHAASRQRQRDEMMSVANPSTSSHVSSEHSLQSGQCPPKVAENLLDQREACRPEEADPDQLIVASAGVHDRRLFYDLPPPMHRLGQSLIDPFDSFATKGLPDYVYKVLYFGKSLQISPWPVQREHVSMSSEILTSCETPKLTHKLMPSGRNQMGQPQTLLVSPAGQPTEDGMAACQRRISNRLTRHGLWDAQISRVDTYRPGGRTWLLHLETPDLRTDAPAARLATTGRHETSSKPPPCHHHSGRAWGSP